MVDKVCKNCRFWKCEEENPQGRSVLGRCKSAKGNGLSVFRRGNHADHVTSSDRCEQFQEQSNDQ